MKFKLLASTMAAAILGAAALIGVSATAAPTTTVSTPERADNFQLTDTTRLAHELHYFKDAKAIVLMSQINGSDGSRKAAAQLEKIKAAYPDKGVLFYMINSKDSRDAAAVEVKKQGYDIPVLMDEMQLVGESLGVQREGEVFIVDPKTGFRIAYHGPLADTAQGARRRPRRQGRRQPAHRSEDRRPDHLRRARQGGRARQHLLHQRCRADPPGQVRHLPPEGRHRPLRDGQLRGRQGDGADDPRIGPRPSACLPISPIRTSARSRTTRA